MTDFLSFGALVLMLALVLSGVLVPGHVERDLERRIEEKQLRLRTHYERDLAPALARAYTCIERVAEGVGGEAAMEETAKAYVERVLPLLAPLDELRAELDQRPSDPPPFHQLRRRLYPDAVWRRYLLKAMARG